MVFVDNEKHLFIEIVNCKVKVITQIITLSENRSFTIIISLPFASFFANFLPFVYYIRWFGLNIRQARGVDKFA